MVGALKIFCFNTFVPFLSNTEARVIYIFHDVFYVAPIREVIKTLPSIFFLIIITIIYFLKSGPSVKSLSPLWPMSQKVCPLLVKILLEKSEQDFPSS